MLRPTLVVGLGSSGLKAVENVQKLMYETIGLNSLSVFKYMYIETDQGNEIEPTPLGSDIIPVKAYVRSLRSSLDILENNENLNMDWVPENVDAELAGINAGAGGVRPGGRLALWCEDNFNRIYQQINNAFDAIVNPNAAKNIPDEIERTAGGFNPTPIVYVTGTLCGGTNAGMFIDIGYMIRQITGMRDGGAIYGIFLLPPDGLNLPAGYGNCKGALNELEFFRDPLHRYEENWPNGIYCTSHLPPYAIVYMVSQEYGDPQFGKIKSLDGLYKIVGLQIFSNLLGMSDLRTSVLVDGLNAGFGFYSTFGISAISYPKYSISEYMACEVGQELCQRWLNVNNYCDANNAINDINEPVVKTEAYEFFDKILESAFEILESRGALEASLFNEINEDVNKIIKRQIESPTRYLHNKFSSHSKDSYYAVTNGNLKSARNLFIESIYTTVLEKLNETQNIRCGELFTLGVQERIVKTFDLWNAYHIPEDINQWNTSVTSELSRLIENPHNLLLQKSETIRERLVNLLRKLKMFLMRNILHELKDNIEIGMMVSTRDTSIYLPTVNKFHNYKDVVKNIQTILETRKGKVTQDIKDDTLPIFKIWREGSFEKDCENTLKLFKQQKGGLPHSKDISQDKLWNLLDTKKSSDLTELSEKIKRTYQGQIMPCIPNVNILQEAKDRIEQTKNYANRAISSLIRLEHGGRSGHGVPRFVLGKEENALRDLISSLNDAGYEKYSLNDAKVVNFLDQLILFYEEKSNVNPHDDLMIRESLKRNFTQVPKDYSGKLTMSQEIWRNFRLAYSINRREEEEESSGRIDLIKNLMQFVLDFIPNWKISKAGHWQSKEIKEEFTIENLSIDSDPPIYKICTPGEPVYHLKINPEDKKVVEDLSRSQENFNTFHHEISEIAAKVTRDKLLEIFNGSVQPYLERRFNIDTANDRANLFFAQGDEKGFIDELIGNKINGD